MTAPWPVAALWVDSDGPYRHLADEVYGVERDARTYAGPLPVVAHPPCGPWGRLAWACRYQDRQAGPDAVDQVRTYGGVLEHPVGSRLFEYCDIPVGRWDDPWRETDPWGGYTIMSPQWHWGHRGKKATVLYVVGTHDLPPWPRRDCDTAPIPVQNMGRRERRRTPPALAWWLCDLASRCTLTGTADSREPDHPTQHNPTQPNPEPS